MTRLGLRHQIGQRQIGIGTCHEVNPMLFQQLFFHTLGHTAQHADD